MKLIKIILLFLFKNLKKSKVRKHKQRKRKLRRAFIFMLLIFVAGAAGGIFLRRSTRA